MNYDHYPRRTCPDQPQPFEDTDPYYHVEYCFVRGADQTILKADIEVGHITVWLDQMLRFGAIKLISVQLQEGN